MRLDKFLCDQNLGSRSQVKELLRKGSVSVNGSVVRECGLQIREEQDIVCVGSKTLSYQKAFYYMLYKPAGVVTASKDAYCKTVLDFFPKPLQKHLFPVGRLDKDTEGLLLLTTDGDLCHRLLAPKRHVDKVYYVRTKEALDEEQCKSLEQGLDIGEKTLTMPAKAVMLSPYELELTIQEGKFHQVKRMLCAVGNQVVYLKRLSFGALQLDETLSPGEYRELTDAEVVSLQERPHQKAKE